MAHPDKKDRNYQIHENRKLPIDKKYNLCDNNYIEARTPDQQTTLKEKAMKSSLNKIDLIKSYRRLTNLGLVEAKEAVEVFYNLKGWRDGYPLDTYSELASFLAFVEKIVSKEWEVRERKVHYARPTEVPSEEIAAVLEVRE